MRAGWRNGPGSATPIRGDGRHRPSRWTRCGRCRDEGFTLVELLIVMVVVPIVIGGLAVGLLSFFSLQNSVSSRLSNTADSQMVAATYRNDIQSAAEITTDNGLYPQCGSVGSGTELLGLEWNLNQVTGNYENVVSYVEVPNGSTYSLERLYCSLGVLTPKTTETISYNLQAALGGPTLLDLSGDPISAQNGWVKAQTVGSVDFSVFEPQGKGTYEYTLEAAPASSSSPQNNGGAPLSPSTTTSCGFAAAGSGPLASSLCFINFAPLTGNNLLAAEEGCLEMSVTLPGSYIMYFCLGIQGDPIYATSMPTYEDAFLGNSGTYTPPGGQPVQTGITPNYYNIPGNPALYQSCEGYAVLYAKVPGTNVSQCDVNAQGQPQSAGSNGPGDGVTTLTFTGIKVVTPQNVKATGWQFVSADAETTDVGESTMWTAGAPATSLNIINNGYGAPTDSSTDPVGNACNGGNQTWGNSQGFLAQNPTNADQVECSGGTHTTGAGKTGTTMVEALSPGTFTIVMTGTGLEATAFGLLMS